MNVEGILGTAIFILGACIGSFLNVCIYRWPQEKSVRTPSRSYCPHCEKTIPWYDNIPLVSYSLLGGKCRSCKKSISFQYFFVELLTAVTFLIFYLKFGLSSFLLPYLVMVSAFIVATFVDFRHRIIPDQVSLGCMWLGLIFSLIFPSLHHESAGETHIGRVIMKIVLVIILLYSFYEFMRERKKSVQDKEKSEEEQDSFVTFFVVIFFFGFDSLISFLPKFGVNTASNLYLYFQGLDQSVVGLLVGGGVIYVMGILGECMFKKEAMGGGDVKLMAMIGAFLGWKAAMMTFFIAPFFGAIFGIAEKIRTKDTAIAYGPFLVLGAIITLFWGDHIFLWVLHQYGIY